MPCEYCSCHTNKEGVQCNRSEALLATLAALGLADNSELPTLIRELCQGDLGTQDWCVGHNAIKREGRSSGFVKCRLQAS